MPGLFIDVTVDSEVASDPAIAKKLEEVCPVSIFAAAAPADGGGVSIVQENLDECVLCDLCLEVAPGKVHINKLYE